MNMNAPVGPALTDEPVIVPVEAYISQEYAREEASRLWRKVWQVACREEEIPKVGDYYTYDILDESIIVVRTDPDEISAYYNVCQHRGRRLTDGCGHTKRFHCKYHGWQYSLAGENVRILDPEDWGGTLDAKDVGLGKVKVGRWGGYVFVNMDPHCETLEAFLGEAPHWLDPLEIGKMRYGWRKWSVFPCNWKVFIEGFIEGYHAEITHPQTLDFGSADTYSRGHGRHSSMNMRSVTGGGIGTSVDTTKTGDMRKLVAGSIRQQWETVGSLTTATFVAAADRLLEVLPETATAAEAGAKLMELACQMDAERGVPWPKVDPQHMRDLGINWHIFPNVVILPNVTYCLGFRARPNGDDPDSCIFEIYHLERFPEGQEPAPENVYTSGYTEAEWRLLVSQDFSNFAAIQKGMHSFGLRGVRPNPIEEQGVVNLHRNLAEYMGRGEPRPVETPEPQPKPRREDRRVR